MTNPNTPPVPTTPTLDTPEDEAPACVLVFNASDPSGAGGLSGDVLAISSVGAHAMPVMTGAYVRDTAEVFDFFALDEEAVADQARAILEDVPIQVIKVGFAGSPESVSTIAELAADYADVPVVAYMPNLSWLEESELDPYLDAFRELLLPQTTVLVGNHSTLLRWLLPDWNSERPPGPRELAKAAADFGVPYTLVTGMTSPDQYVVNVLATPQAVLASEKFERFEAVFTGAGDTLSAALAALLGTGTDLVTAASEALRYLDHSLDAGFCPGMGQVVPDRLFWAQAEADEEDGDTAAEHPEPPFNETKH